MKIHQTVYPANKSPFFSSVECEHVQMAVCYFIVKTDEMYTIKQSVVLPMTKEVCWAFFSNPHNLNKLTPPDLHFLILSGADQKMYPGQMIAYEVKPLPGYTTKWLTEIKHVQLYEQFVDEQRVGPYSMWYHIHQFKEVEGGIEVSDIVHYRMPFGWLGKLVHHLFIKKKLERIFSYRNKVMKQLFSTTYANREN